MALANWSWGMYPGLSHGAMNTISEHGTPEQLTAVDLEKIGIGRALGQVNQRAQIAEQRYFDQCRDQPDHQQGGEHGPHLALYIHIPWCVRKCPYCDFNSHTASPVLPEDFFLQHLIPCEQQADISLEQLRPCLVALLGMPGHALDGVMGKQLVDNGLLVGDKPVQTGGTNGGIKQR